MATYYIWNIRWDADTKQEIANVPTKMRICVPDDVFAEDYISEWITNAYGFCHNGFECEKVDISRPHKTATLEILLTDIAKYEKMLMIKGCDYDANDIKELSTIKMWTVRFDDGAFIDIKINSNYRSDGDFFAEAVLFDKNGNQLDFSEVQYDIMGVWHLSSRDCDYTISVVGV